MFVTAVYFLFLFIENFHVRYMDCQRVYPYLFANLAPLYAILHFADVLQTGFFCGQNRAH